MASEVIFPVVNKRYKILDVLGSGSMGCVYRAVDRLTGNTIALKQVMFTEEQRPFPPPSHTTNTRFTLAQEFQLLASLRHPHIINVLDYGFDAQGVPFFTMDYLPQAQTIVAEADHQSLDTKIALILQLLQALAYLHRRGILHRDLKPDNVLVINGEVKLLDFGLSRLFEQDDELLQGTIAYLAPELLQGSPPSQAADLFACGMIAYEVLAGRHPFDTGNPNLLMLNLLYETPDTTALPVAEPLQRFVARLLARAPEERPFSTTEAITQLYNAIGQPAPPETDLIRESYLQAARFVGRQRERDQLTAALAQAGQGQGSAWLIGGESGVGKSRLLAELRTEALVAGALVLQGHAVLEDCLPYQLWRDLLRWLVLVVSPDDSQASTLKAIAPDIETLLDRSVPDVPDLMGKQQLVETIVSLFQQLTQPTLLILEDVQWAAEGLEPLKALIHLAPSLPLLILANYRDDDMPELPAQLPGSQVLKLNRLTQPEVAELSEAILGERGSQPKLIKLLEKETEGNTFFLVEVMRALAEETGRLSAIGQQPLPTRILAGGMQQVVRRRLNRLPDMARPLLNCAAVAGRQLDLNVLNVLISLGSVSMPGDLDTWLDICANTAVLEIKDGQWRFSHDKLREGVLDALAPEAGSGLHRQVAEAIEATYPQQPEWAPALVKHWQEAGDRDRELDYAPEAVHQMLRLFKYPNVVRLGWRTLANMLDLPPASQPKPAHLLAVVRQEVTAEKRPLSATHTNLQEIITLLQRIGEALYRMGDIDTAWETLTLAREGANTLADVKIANRATFWLSQTTAAAGNYAQAEQLLLESRVMAEASGDINILMESLIGLADHNWRLGNMEATRAYCEQAVALADQPHATENPDLLPYASIRLGAVHIAQGNLDAAQDVFENILEILPSTASKGLRAGLFTDLGEVSERRGDLATAQTYYEKALTLLVDIDLHLQIAVIYAHLTRVALQRHNVLAAREQLQASFQEAHQSASDPLLLRLAFMLGWLRLTENRTDEGLAWLGLVLQHTVTPFDLRQDILNLLDEMGLSDVPATHVTAEQQLSLTDVLQTPI